jgi:hypothetical protein
LCILVTVNDKIQTARFIIVAGFYETQKRDKVKEQNRRAEGDKIFSRYRISLAIAAFGKANDDSWARTVVNSLRPFATFSIIWCLADPAVTWLNHDRASRGRLLVPVGSYTQKTQAIDQ